MSWSRTFAVLILCAGLAPAVVLDAVYTTNVVGENVCEPPPRVASFLTTDPEVWLYLSVSNAAARDVLVVTWLQPNGTVYVRSDYDPLPEAGGWCFGDMIGIAGDEAAKYPGTWTISGTWNGAPLFTVNFTLAKPGGACTYALSSSGATVPATGGTGGVLVSTPSTCSWTASKDVSWISLTGATSGNGNGTVSYSVAANTSSNSRQGVLDIGPGAKFSISQLGISSGTGPQITAGGIVNAASYLPPTLPAGAIARGSYFSIYGVNLGPAQGDSQKSYPLTATFGEVTVKITQGSTSVNAYPTFISATQINAIMPSNAPLGDVNVVVTYRGTASPAASLKVVNSNFGIFSLAGGQGPGVIQNYAGPGQVPLNTRLATAKPSQVAILLGTGLGAISGPDNQKPPVGDMGGSVQVLVGGKQATKLYAGRMPDVAGVDQINFQLPADVPYGCYVPVQVKVGNTYSNIVTMSIHPRGEECSDPQNPFSEMVSKGRKGGSISLVRANLLAQLQTGQPALDLLVDLGVGAFEDNSGKGELAFNPLFSLPPVGTCSAYSGNVDLSSLLGGADSLSGSLGLLGRELDAGPSISVMGPKGNVIPMPHLDSEAGTGPYLALLGGTIPLPGAPSLAPFLEPGTFKISGTGGKDVGPFTVTLTVGAPVTWTNRDQITQVDRAAGLPLTWSGGDNSKLILIGGASINQTSKATAGFFCFVPAAPGSFTVPDSVLANLPPTAGLSMEEALGALVLGSLPNGSFPTFQASGLDSGMVFNAALSAKTVGFK